MQASLMFNGNNVERRKMYPIHRRHNQKTNLQLSWMNALESQPPDFHQKQKQKKQKEYQQIRENYNKYVQRELDHEFWSKNRPPKIIPSEEGQTIMTPQSKSKTIDVNKSMNEQVLNRQLQSFKKSNDSSLVSPRYQSIDSPPRININPESQRMYNLHSAFDKPGSYQNQIYWNNKPKAYKNYSYDKLQQHLRFGLKKTSRY